LRHAKTTIVKGNTVSPIFLTENDYQKEEEEEKRRRRSDLG
jgi:hypothetical protein